MSYGAVKTVTKALIAKKTLGSREWLAPGLRLRFSIDRLRDSRVVIIAGHVTTVNNHR
jgi:hypothetical protein